MGDGQLGSVPNGDVQKVYGMKWRPTVKIVDPVRQLAHRDLPVGVWSVLALMAVSATWFTHQYVAHAPVSEDWTDTVPYVLGERSLTPQYLWAQLNEHRMVLPKLIVLPLTKACGGWLPVTNYLTVLVLAAGAAMLLLTLRRIRGKTILADAIIPLALLHFGHADAYVFRFMFNITLWVVLTGAVLAAIAIIPNGIPRVRHIVLVGVLTLCLPLCMASGVPVAVAVALWLLYVGGCAWRAGKPYRHRSAPAAWTAALVLIACVVAYFHGYFSPGGAARESSLWAILQVSLRCLGTCLGPWPHPFGRWPLLLMPAILTATVGLLAWALWRYPEARNRLLGLACVLGAVGAVPLAVGYGRAYLGDHGAIALRYGLLTTPILLTVYFVWVVAGPSRFGTRPQWALLMLLVVMLQPLAHRGIDTGKNMRRFSDDFLQDLRAGVSAEYLAPRYGGLLYPGDPRIVEWVRLHLLQLRDQGFAPYDRLGTAREDFKSLTITTGEAEATGVARFSEHDGESRLAFSLARPTPVKAVRVRFSQSEASRHKGYVRPHWECASASGKWSEQRRNRFLFAGEATEHTVLVWINDQIDRFRLDFRHWPGGIEVRELSVWQENGSDAELGPVATSRSLQLK